MGLVHAIAAMSSLRKQGSSIRNVADVGWIPAFAGMTGVRVARPRHRFNV
jgi:hypothetical protein